VMPTTGFGVTMVGSTDNATRVITWPTATGATATNFTGSVAAQGIYPLIRVVSGCLKVEYIGNTQTDAGLLCAWWQSMVYNNTVGAFGGKMNQFVANQQQAMNQPYGECYPLRQGVCVKWRPCDYSDFDFQQSDVASSLAGSYPYIGFTVQGAAANSPFKVRIVFNYEGLTGPGGADFVNATPNFGNQESITKASIWGQTVTDKITPMNSGISPDNTIQSQSNMANYDNILKAVNRVSANVGKAYSGQGLKGVKSAWDMSRLLEATGIF